MKQVKNVPAIEKAIAIIEYLEKNPNGAALSEICAALDIPKSSAHGILATLMNFGYLTVQTNNSRFVLGTRFLSLAIAAEKGIDLVRIAEPFMEELRGAIDETVKISVKSRGSAVVVAKIEAEKEYHAGTKIGTHFPLHAGAAGKILLAYSPAFERDQYLESELERYTPATITAAADLKGALSLIKERGWAEDKGERFEDIYALACPIFNHAEDVVAALSVAFLAVQNDERKRREVLARLTDCAKKISRAMGSSAC